MAKKNNNMKALENYNRAVSEFDLLRQRMEKGYKNILSKHTAGIVEFITAPYMVDVTIAARNEVETLYYTNPAPIEKRVNEDRARLTAWVKRLREVNKINHMGEKLAQAAVNDNGGMVAQFANIEGTLSSFFKMGFIEKGKRTKRRRNLTELIHEGVNAEYIMKYENRTPAGIAALIVAAEMHDHKPQRELLDAINVNFNTTFTRQNIDHHIFKYASAAKTQISGNTLWKEIKRLRRELSQ